MPLREMSLVRLVAEDWRSMARISAEYCLFWVTGFSGFLIRERSHSRNCVSLPIVETMEGREERVSRTLST